MFLYGAQKRGQILYELHRKAKQIKAAVVAKKKEPLSPWGSTLVPKVGQTQLPFDDAVVECGAKRAQFPTNKRKNLFPSF